MLAWDSSLLSDRIWDCRCALYRCWYSFSSYCYILWTVFYSLCVCFWTLISKLRTVDCCINCLCLYGPVIYTSLFAQIAATKQIKQHTKLTNNYDKSKNLLNTALRSWRTVLILSPNCVNILCNCRRASFANSIHKLFSEAVNLFKKLAVRISIWLLAGRNPKLSWHSLAAFAEPVRKSFIKMRVNVNSNDKVWRASNGHASTAYSKIGIHLLRSKLKITGSDAHHTGPFY